MANAFKTTKPGKGAIELVETLNAWRDRGQDERLAIRMAHDLSYADMRRKTGISLDLFDTFWRDSLRWIEKPSKENGNRWRLKEATE